ncbi:MAG: integrase, partial [Methylococcales bacterium]|nr:integrase [Methylococcales bacterium]
QKQILLGQELISKTAKRLQLSKDNDSTLTIAKIYQMLNVEAVENTNLVKMIAEGPNPKILPLLINTWLDVYLDSRKKEVSQSTSSITESLQQELSGLTVKIESKRHELDTYRKENNISSSQRDENEALAHLKGLNDALNTATEEAVNAKARLQSVTHAINSGQAVISEADTRTLSLLELQAQVLREQVADMDQRFTRQYIAMVPTLKIIPEKLEKLEAQIYELRTSGKYVVLDDAKQKYAAATQALKNIRNQLNAHNKQTADFTTLFTKHEALQSDLKNLDILFNETQDRLIKIEAKQIEKHPQVSVIERAFLPQEPIRPNYIQDALIAIAGSILISLSLVWFVIFLNRKDEANTA